MTCNETSNRRRDVDDVLDEVLEAWEKFFSDFAETLEKLKELCPYAVNTIVLSRKLSAMRRFSKADGCRENTLSGSPWFYTSGFL